MSNPLFVTKNGESHGPYTIEEMQAHLSAGTFSPDDLAWREGMTDWQPIRILLAGSLPPPIPPPPAQLAPPPSPAKSAKKGCGCLALLICSVFGFFGLCVLVAIFSKLTRSASEYNSSGAQPSLGKVETTVATAPVKKEDKSPQKAPPSDKVKQAEIPPAPPKDTAEKAVKLGQTFRLGDFSYTITSALRQDDLLNLLLKSDGQKNAAPSDAPAILEIRYLIKNEGNEATVVSTIDFKVIDSKGRTFTTSSDATEKLVEEEGADFLVKELQPGIAKPGVQAFELPNGSFDGKLVLIVPEKGVFSSGETRVALGR